MLKIQLYGAPMSRKFWTLLSGALEVQVFFDRAELDAQVVSWVRQCTGDDTVTIDNWEQRFADLNATMETNGDAEYLCHIKEHDLPSARAVVVLEDGGLHNLFSDSPLIAGAELAVINASFDDQDYDQGDIMELEVNGMTERFVGHQRSVSTAVADELGGDIAAVFDAIENKDNPAPQL